MAAHKITDQMLLEYYRDFIARNKYAPSQREAAAHFHVSNDTLHSHLKNLLSQGKLAYTEKSFRNITVIDWED